MRLDTITRVASALDARSFIRIDWQGEAADRLLDADHAGLVEHVLLLLRRAGWDVVPEVTYAIGGERGSLDILAWHPSTSTVLVVEVKTVVPDVQAMLATFDRKVRHVEQIARARGWRPVRVAQLLVVAESRTSRRRVDAHATTFVARFPHGATEARRLIAQPAAWPLDRPTLRGVVLVT